MKKLKKIYLTTTVFILCSISQTSFSREYENSKRIDELFNTLSFEATDFEPMGEVCERVALIEVEPMYPKNQFEIVNSIEYAENKTTIGELDLVIFDKVSGKVEAIAEVKCWKSFKGALLKVKDQRQRFLTHLNRNIVLTDIDGKKIPKEKFNNIKKMFSISSLGGVEAGFDMELSLDFKELMELRNRLLDCKAQSKCPRQNSIINRL